MAGAGKYGTLKKNSGARTAEHQRSIPYWHSSRLALQWLQVAPVFLTSAPPVSSFCYHLVKLESNMFRSLRRLAPRTEASVTEVMYPRRVGTWSTLLGWLRVHPWFFRKRHRYQTSGLPFVLSRVPRHQDDPATAFRYINTHRYRPTPEDIPFPSNHFSKPLPPPRRIVVDLH